jgi:hypothetical protein
MDELRKRLENLENENKGLQVRVREGEKRKKPDKADKELVSLYELCLSPDLTILSRNDSLVSSRQPNEQMSSCSQQTRKSMKSSNAFVLVIVVTNF